jgi:hypothetical protein
MGRQAAASAAFATRTEVVFMPALHVLLARIADQLALGGAQSSQRTMALMSAGMTFLTSLNRPLDDEVAAAAYVTAQFKPIDPKPLEAAFGIRPDLIPRLRPLPHLDAAHDLMDPLSRGTGDQAIVAATALYSWYAMCAQIGDATKAKELREIANITAVPAAIHGPLGGALIAAMDALKLAAPAPAPGPTEHLFSVSIDLCGSTDAKRQMLEVLQGNEKRIDRENELFYGQFCRIEERFYKALVGRYGRGRAIDPAKLFTVKGIGDEMWTLCPASAGELVDIGQRLVDAAIEVVSDSVHMMVTENDDRGRFSQKFDYGKVVSINSPIKIFIDLVSHATSISAVRDEVLMGSIPELLEQFHGRKATPIEVATVSRRLSLAAYEPIGNVVQQTYRTDFIGNEIDRFFRTTKAARPGTVTVGQAFVDKVGLVFHPVHAGMRQVFDGNQQPFRGGAASEPLHAWPQTLTNLKGLNASYNAYTLFNPLALKGNYVMMESEKDNGGAGTAYDDTLKDVPRAVVDFLADKNVQDRAA